MTNTASTTFTLTDVANTKIEYQPETVGLGTQIGIKQLQLSINLRWYY